MEVETHFTFGLNSFHFHGVQICVYIFFIYLEEEGSGAQWHARGGIHTKTIKYLVLGLSVYA
jgi:hypothetical protein